MDILNKINSEVLVELLEKKGCSKYYDSDAKANLAILCSDFNELASAINGDITVKLNTGILNSGICDKKTEDEFENIALEANDYKFIFKNPKVLSMKLSHGSRALYHILTSIGIISLRDLDIYKLQIVNSYQSINEHYIISITTFNGEVITLDFKLITK